MKRVFFHNILIFFIFSSAMYSQETVEKNYNTFSEFLTEQNTKISMLKNGISLLEVKEIMGGSMIVKVPEIGEMRYLSQLFKQPEFMKKTSDNVKNEIYILWYFSTPKNQDGIVSKSECTPVIIKNDSLIGKGTKFYSHFMRTGNLRF